MSKEEEMAALGKRAVACERFRWLPGMLALHEVRASSGVLRCAGIINTRLQSEQRFCGPGAGEVWMSMADIEELLLPDLTDPATLGCLLHLVREAQSDPKASACPIGPTSQRVWVCVGPGNYPAVYAPTEAEALVCALEAAWGEL